MFSLPAPTGSAAFVVFEATPFAWPPTSVFPGYTFDGISLQIPLSALSEYHLTAELASAERGDGRQVAASLIGRLEEWMTEQTTRPTAIGVRTVLSVPSYGDFAYKEKQQITFTMYTERPSGELVEEL